MESGKETARLLKTMTATGTELDLCLIDQRLDARRDRHTPCRPRMNRQHYL